MHPVKKILIVDDDIDILEQTKIQLELKGITVITAENITDGWAIFQKEKPDACILDLMMEQYDSGFVLAHKIKRNEYGKTIPVYVVTAVTYVTGMKFEADTEEEREWIQADEVLNKPIIVDELLEKIENFYAAKES